MPNHIEGWYKRAEADYFMMFVRQWIPFNVWFMDAYYQVNGSRPTDREAIYFLKANNNRFRDKIVNLLNGHDAEKSVFFFHLACLHKELQSHPISNKGNRVTLSNIHIENNSSTVYTFDFGHYTYKCEMQHPHGSGIQWDCLVMKKAGHVTVHQFSLPKWDLHSFETHPDYLAIDKETVKVKLRNCFMEINPKKPTDIVLPMRTRNGSELPPLNSIEISKEEKLYVVNDAVKVSQVIIELLYILRCLIFHGELEPKQAFYGIYEHAYHIQRILNKELI